MSSLNKIGIIGLLILLIVTLSLGTITILQPFSTVQTDQNNIATAQMDSVSQYEFEEKQIPIVAVSSSGNGVVGTLSMKLIPGDENIYINTNALLQTDLQYSAKEAVEYAQSDSQKNIDSDYILTYNAGEAQLIGGESAGAATTLLAMAMLNGYTIKNDSVITGTINPDGTIGPIGGVYAKAQAVAEQGYKNFLVPTGETQLVYYRGNYIPASSIRYSRGYNLQTINLVDYAKQQWGLNVVSVNNIEEAIPYFF